MNFLDIENYENLMKIYKLNKDIYILKLEINEFEDKKKSNLYFLNIQQEVYNTTIMKKKTIIKKYKFQIIKNILNMHLLQKKHKELIKIEQYYIDLITDLYYSLSHFSIYKYNTKKNIGKILNKLNDINKLDSIINYKYIKLFNDFYIEQPITQQKILKAKLNIEFKEYLKYKPKCLNQITKVENIINKNMILKNKNLKKKNLLHQKTINIKNKYLYIQKDIIIYENRNVKSYTSINKNIHELNIRISIKNKQLIEYQNEINICHNNIELLNNIKGDKILTHEQCSICLEDINKGIQTSCNHFFHYGCINMYIFNILQQNTKFDIKCPICRQYI
jgi:hypothetical protein